MRINLPKMIRLGDLPPGVRLAVRNLGSSDPDRHADALLVIVLYLGRAYNARFQRSHRNSHATVRVRRTVDMGSMAERRLRFSGRSPLLRIIVEWQTIDADPHRRHAADIVAVDIDRNQLDRIIANFANIPDRKRSEIHRTASQFLLVGSNNDTGYCGVAIRHAGQGHPGALRQVSSRLDAGHGHAFRVLAEFEHNRFDATSARTRHSEIALVVRLPNVPSAEPRALQQHHRRHQGPNILY